MEPSLLSREYRDGVYIPAGLLVVGTLIVKRDWLPYAVLVALALGSWKFYGMRELAPTVSPSGWLAGRQSVRPVDSH